MQGESIVTTATGFAMEVEEVLEGLILECLSQMLPTQDASLVLQLIVPQ